MIAANADLLKQVEDLKNDNETLMEEHRSVAALQALIGTRVIVATVSNTTSMGPLGGLAPRVSGSRCKQRAHLALCLVTAVWHAFGARHKHRLTNRRRRHTKV